MYAGLAELLDSPEGNVPSVGGLFAMGKKLDRLHSAAGIGQQHGGGCVQCRVDAIRGAAALAESADDVVGSVQLHDTSGASAGSPEPSRRRVIERRANTKCVAGKAAGTGRASGENLGGARQIGDSGPRLGIAKLEVARRRYMNHGLAFGTRRAYSSAQMAYLGSARGFPSRQYLQANPRCVFLSRLLRRRVARLRRLGHTFRRFGICMCKAEGWIRRRRGHRSWRWSCEKSSESRRSRGSAAGTNAYQSTRRR